MNRKEVRVRIAPSPTGYFHVGTARTAIYNWLFARKHNGKFLVRIEDTDRERSKQEFVDIILDGLKWMGLEWDDDVVYQSKRVEDGCYSQHIVRLLSQGNAYRCFYAPDELASEREKAREEKRNFKARKYRNLPPEESDEYAAQGRSFTIRLKLPTEGEALFNDIVCGEIKRSYDDLDDPIIMKSDGSPIYNFAVVVDDHDMGISQVIRGNDHITNTFYQAEIYRALRWEPPVFAHLPMILRPDRSKVSKRKGDKGVTDYRNEGYLPQALVNYSALVGWSPKDDREVMSREELIDSFALEGVNPNNAIFDTEKLNWFNGEYIRRTEPNQLVDMVSPFLIEAGLTTKYWIETNWHWTVRVIDTLRERCKRLIEFVESGSYFFSDDFSYDPKGVRKQFSKDGTSEILRTVSTEFEQMANWSADALDSTLRNLAEKLGEKPARLIHPVRLAVSGSTKGPGLFDILDLIGKDRVQQRLNRAIQYIEQGEFSEAEGS
jgi:glutamyl-tRNA synthetase